MSISCVFYTKFDVKITEECAASEDQEHSSISDAGDQVWCHLSNGQDPSEEGKLADARTFVHASLIDVNKSDPTNAALKRHNKNCHSQQNSRVELDLDENHNTYETDKQYENTSLKDLFLGEAL